MPYEKLDRDKLNVKPLKARKNKIEISKTYAACGADPENLTDEAAKTISEAKDRIVSARKNKKPVMLVFGAHTIKNGLGPVLIKLIEDGWVTHLATNGAGIIHDWEFAFQGLSSEDVRGSVGQGQFGIWQETGFYINLAIVAGAYEELGYGEAVGKMIYEEALDIPSAGAIEKEVLETGHKNPDKAAAAVDFMGVIEKFKLKEGKMKIPHPYKQYSVQAAAYRLKVPFTGHPMIGHDIIYNHPMNNGAAIGRTALRDFLVFANSVSRIEGGVYMSVGSAVMSPMIFEKALSMAQNLAIQKGKHIDSHYMVVVDLAQSSWDWKKDGEPPADNSAYYLRYCKTFNRMGGTMRYVSADNRDFLLGLCSALSRK